MADSQVPWGVDALGGTISDSAWRSKPSWFLVTARTPDDSPIGPARDVRPRWSDGHRDTRQSDVMQFRRYT